MEDEYHFLLACEMNLLFNHFRASFDIDLSTLRREEGLGLLLSSPAAGRVADYIGHIHDLRI